MFLHDARFPGFLLAAGIAATSLLPAPSARAFDPHVFALTTDGSRGNSAALGLLPPWPAAIEVEAVGPAATVRHFFGRHYVVNRDAATVQVIDPATFDTILQFSVGAGSSPRDIAVVDRRTAYVSRHDHCRLYKVDPTTGVGTDSVDLCAFADADGLPEMSMLALDGNHLLIQLQRYDRVGGGNVAPAYLAVVDVTTDTLVDVDPQLPGVQAIALTGTNPSYKMHLEPESRRLYVCTPGAWLDQTGGIEAVDLDALRTLGWVTTEKQIQGADISRFVLVSPHKGYVISHTDLLLSSHLTAFSRSDGSPLGGEVHFTVGMVEGLDFDPATSQLFIATPEGSPGIDVLDTRTDAVLTATPVATGLRPADLVIALDVTPGEATELRVGIDRADGRLSLRYRPACAAPDHHVVYGPLEAVGVYGYAGRVCAIGRSGRHDGFDPGPGSSFFLVAGDDGTLAGSYGRDSTGAERPLSAVGPPCGNARDLGRACAPLAPP